MPTKHRGCYKRRGAARVRCYSWYDKVLAEARPLAKCCPSIARDPQTDVSRTTAGVWYVISGQETKLGHWPAARPRAPAKCSGNAPQPEPVTRPGEERPLRRRDPATPAAATPRAPESGALRVVYEIHLIGEREREQQLYDLRSTMYFAIAIKGIAASP